MSRLLFATLALAAMTSFVLSKPLTVEKCNKDNCKLPNCRCWNDQETPGNFSKSSTPMMVILSFNYAMNNATTAKYMELFDGLTDPNGCPARGTFYVQEVNSEPETLKYVYSKKHEVAVNSYNGVTPMTSQAWYSSFDRTRNFINKSGIPLSEINGTRTTNLFAGGNAQMEAMSKLGLTYDASCLSIDHSETNNLLWPFTLDYVENLPKCSIGHTPNEAFPGLWMFPVPVLTYNKTKCAIPTACQPKTVEDVSKMLFDSFQMHYISNRAPFILQIDPEWLLSTERFTGTKQFLEIILMFGDTWVITMSEALDWIKNPKELSQSYKPWSC